MRSIEALIEDLELFDIIINRLTKDVLQNTNLLQNNIEMKSNAQYIFDTYKKINEAKNKREELVNIIEELKENKLCNSEVDNSIEDILINARNKGDFDNEKPKLTSDELLKMKPIDFIAYIFEKSTYDKKLTKSDVENFVNENWCLEHLSINCALLKKYNSFIDFNSQKNIDGKVKYSATLISIYDEEYFYALALTSKVKTRIMEYFNNLYGWHDEYIKNQLEGIERLYFNDELIAKIETNTLNIKYLMVGDTLIEVFSASAVLYEFIKFIQTRNLLNKSVIDLLKIDDKPIISLKRDDLINPKELFDGYFFQTNHPIEKTAKLIQIVIRSINLKQDIFIYAEIKQKNKSLKNDIKLSDPYSRLQMLNEFAKLIVQ